jgi:hypothetical protein
MGYRGNQSQPQNPSPTINIIKEQFMPRRTLSNSFDKDKLSEDGIPTLPILTRAQHQRLIEEQRAIIRTLIRDFSPERDVYYTLFDTPQIVHEDTLEDILEVQLVIYEIIFNQRSRTVYVFYTRNLTEGTFTCHQGEQDDIPEGPPQYDLDGIEIHTDKESKAT